MAGTPNFQKTIWKLILSSISSQKIRKFCVWEGMVAIVFTSREKASVLHIYTKSVEPVFQSAGTYSRRWNTDC